jgi:hypothetical protein
VFIISRQTFNSALLTVAYCIALLIEYVVVLKGKTVSNPSLTAHGQFIEWIARVNGDVNEIKFRSYHHSFVVQVFILLFKKLPIVTFNVFMLVLTCSFSMSLQ